MNISRLLPDFFSNQCHELPKGERLRSDRIHGGPCCVHGLLDGNFCQIFHIDRLNPIPSRSKDRKHGALSNQPGNVVDENVLFPKHERRSNNGKRNAGAPEHRFLDRFASIIRQIGFEGRSSDTNVHDSLNACLLGAAKERFGVLQGGFIGLTIEWKANPVGIVEGVCSLERSSQCVRIIEVVRKRLDGRAERVRFVRRDRPRRRRPDKRWL